jgi:hypothetical protein
VVDVPDGADVYVRFASIEFFFGHVTDPRAVAVPAEKPPRLSHHLEPMSRIELETSSLPRTRSAN